MFVKPRLLVTQAALLAILWVGAAEGQDIRITIPKRSKPTPVQKLNRDGVKAVEKHDYAKAKRLFYQAYLLDPNDPFTLNNLGYVAELEGEIERAQRFYALAAENPSEAMVDQASSPELEGKSVAAVAGQAQESQMQVNRLNVAAIGLMQKDRAPEADILLQRALRIDPKNPFTLNNLGLAQEKQGEWEKALGYYSQAARTGSQEAVIVTVNSKWRGKGIGEVAAENADQIRSLMRKGESVSARVARLNLRGVSALNRNERRTARAYFEEAHRLDPNDAFTLNNMGYVAEMDGDRETANFFYRKAEEAERAGARVDVASRREAEGQQLGSVAEHSNLTVEARMQQELEAKRRRGGPIVLKRRDNTPVVTRPADSQGNPPAMAQPPAQETTPESTPPDDRTNPPAQQQQQQNPR
ncbi:MAG TPA: tetratricopeptide repeat protein [Terriglobales bacterium]|nr:tetratricopeptide repeat protein [Terriglobales bacterium]